MIAIEYLFGCLAIMAGGGYWLSHRYGTEQYVEGMKQALLMHNDGRLQYEVYFDEDDVEMIERMERACASGR